MFEINLTYDYRSVNLKQFLLFSIIPKNERKMGKKYLKELSGYIFSFFVRFFEELKIPKIAFEIFWPLPIWLKF